MWINIDMRCGGGARVNEWKKVGEPDSERGEIFSVGNGKYCRNHTTKPRPTPEYRIAPFDAMNSGGLLSVPDPVIKQESVEDTSPWPYQGLIDLTDDLDESTGEPEDEGITTVTTLVSDRSSNGVR